MATGTVEWFNATNGCGFIQPDGSSKDVLAHLRGRTSRPQHAQRRRVKPVLISDRGRSYANDYSPSGTLNGLKMAWSVQTFSRKLLTGTCLCLTEKPQISGSKYPKAGERFVINTATDRINATVVSSTAFEMLITTDVGRWQLTPWALGDDLIRVQVSGMQSEYWVIRSRA